MLIDYRHHIFTLVAIFLALGLGVLIGGALFTEDSLVKSQADLVNRLEHDFNNLRAENRKLVQSANLLRSELNLEKQFADWILPWAIEGKLAGETFALVNLEEQTIDRKSIAELVKLLEKSGGEVLAQVALKPELWSQAQIEDFQMLTGILAAGLRGPRLVELEYKGYIQFSGREPFPAQRILLLGQEDKVTRLRSYFIQVGLWVQPVNLSLSTSQEKARFIFKLVEEINRASDNGAHPSVQ